ncbi:hypothetical protein BU24DRAFT_420746 [Aaosphaeria arxii CBS 175.79]|uniref:Uncharacterized protein n=1 Tax=Aaosphaeria arxii CBS 175.79 TaxID=1450172 RepID=A0A6A5XWJ2_9PLEO|nr:uncharacterized protein BU24DRAFT_420746 [Aaosphaeria arxii CBS 175.79]KAF2017698.1 hypothetical protein BU24DRAFT_420746 [Aaosphaeria arxii CBS 175.79]
MTSRTERGKRPVDTGAPERPVGRSNSTQERASRGYERDANAPLRRLRLHQKCLYERTLPGNAFISAHVNRLQRGYYRSDLLHEPALDDVYFVSVHFVFHAHDHRSHRIRSAVIRVGVHANPDTDVGKTGIPRHSSRPASNHPRILGHAPELMYGAISPEDLQWNFSLSSSLGISQAPIAATLNPSGGLQSNYKIYDMMSIQGSLRSLQSPLGPDFDVEDAMAVWTLEENLLQRSGLPREFDFVLLVHKPSSVRDVYLSVDVDPKIEGWFGDFPQWYQNLPKFMPTQDRAISFRTDIGQKFSPIHSRRGFNFADLPRPLEEYVAMPGTTYPTNAISSPNRPGTRDPDPLDELWPGHDPPDRARDPIRWPDGHNRGCRRDCMHYTNANSQIVIPEAANVRVVYENPPFAAWTRIDRHLSPIPNEGDARNGTLRRRQRRYELKDEVRGFRAVDIGRNPLSER